MVLHHHRRKLLHLWIGALLLGELTEIDLGHAAFRQRSVERGVR
jgi:hypothetical protein